MARAFDQLSTVQQTGGGTLPFAFLIRCQLVTDNVIASTFTHLVSFRQVVLNVCPSAAVLG